MKKKYIFLAAFLVLGSSVYGMEYVPKNNFYETLKDKEKKRKQSKESNANKRNQNSPKKPGKANDSKPLPTGKKK